jgi:thiamine-monophosphate kinase
MRDLRVSDLSETELLGRIFPLLPPGAATLVGPGDDAAVIGAPDGRFVVSTDVLVEDRHFRRAWSSGEMVGRRAASQNLADVAAMGARPTALVVSLVVPGDLPVEWVVGLARGLAARCGPVGAAVVGGDLSGGEAVVVAVTVHGDLDGRAPVLRSGARPGDVVAHSGVRGWSAAGLALLERFGPAGVPGGVATARVLDQYRQPDPPVADGPLAAAAGATAMLDVSDGLVRDARRLARAGGVVLDLDGSAFDTDRELLEGVARLLEPEGMDDGGGRSAGVASRVDGWVLGGGEDHGLLATFPPAAVLPGGFRAVGRVLAAHGPGDPVLAGGGVLVDGQVPATAGGWDHFAGARAGADGAEGRAARQARR